MTRSTAIVVPVLLSVASVTACAPEMDHAEAEELRVDLVALAEHAPENLRPGKASFEARCSSCHGPAGGGTDAGPPLIHSVYRPGHHADISFFIAISQGVRAHHWRFGDMPPVPGVEQDEAEQIVAYIRWLQKGLGIF